MVKIPPCMIFEVSFLIDDCLLEKEGRRKEKNALLVVVGRALHDFLFLCTIQIANHSFEWLEHHIIIQLGFDCF